MPNQIAAISNTNAMRNLETAPFNEITQEEVEAYAWAACIKEWTMAALNYNANIIKRVIIERLPLDMQNIMLATDTEVQKKRSKEQKALTAERH